MTKVKDKVIVKYLLLPLLGIVVNKISDFFRIAYIDKVCDTLFLSLVETDISFQATDYVKSLPNYYGKVYINDIEFYMISVPKERKKDTKLLCKGKYSQLSDEGKELIRKLSGLPYKVYVPELKSNKTSAPLLALEKHPQYKAQIEKKLGVIMDDSDELYDKPTDEIFIETFMEESL